MGPKIATCCYCGTRAALVLDKGRHELTCSSCGAPLRNLKRMPSDSAPTRRPKARPAPPRQSPKPARKQKKRKSLRKKLFEEVWDAIEDVFD